MQLLTENDIKDLSFREHKEAIEIINDLIKDAYDEGFDTGYNQCLNDKAIDDEYNR